MDLISPEEPWTAGMMTGPVVELKLIAPATDSGEIEGYAATFGNVDFGQDTIAPRAFADSLAAHRDSGTSPAMLWAHRQGEPTGRWTAMGEDSHGLRVRGKVNGESEAGRKALTHIRAGDVTGLSIGYGIAAGGSKVAHTGRLLTKLHLHEISIVATPMDPRARITSVKSLGSRAELEDLLRESGLPKGACKKIAVAGWSALNGEPVTEDAETKAAMTAALGRFDRVLNAHLSELKGLIR